MGTLYVDQLMARPVETVTMGTTVHEAADRLVEHDVGALVVVDDADRFAGLLTVGKFVHLVREGADADLTVAAVMDRDVATTSRDAPVRDVATAMLDNRVHHVPVLEDGDPVGMLTTMDLAAYLARTL